MIKIAELQDKDLVVSLAMKRVEELADQFLQAPKEEKIVLTYGEDAILVGMVFPTHLGYLATDVLWYVVPEKRGTGIAGELLDAFEFWAAKVGCSLISMTTLNPSSGKSFFEKRGYIAQELAYTKQLNNNTKKQISSDLQYEDNYGN